MPKRGEHLTPEHRAKLIESNRTRVLSVESRAKISAANRGRIAGPRSPETKAKLSAALRGKKRTLAQRSRMSLAQRGKTLSTEHRAKIGAVHKGIPKSAESRARNRETHLNLPVIGECVYCWGPATMFDHMIPRGRPGWDDPGNMVPSCNFCNARKNNRTPEEWFSAMAASHARRLLAGTRRSLRLGSEYGRADSG